METIISAIQKMVIKEVVLYVAGKKRVNYNYVSTKTWHSTQKIKWLNDNHLEIKLDIVINTELKKMILANSKNIKTLAPDKFKNEIIEEG